MFLNAQSNHQWDIKLEISWHYFFSSHRCEQLEYLVELLSPKGFSLIGIYTIDHGKAFILHIEELQSHTSNSLKSRHSIFKRIAKQMADVSYQGVDVTPTKSKREVPWWKLTN